MGWILFRGPSCFHKSYFGSLTQKGFFVRFVVMTMVEGHKARAQRPNTDLVGVAGDNAPRDMDLT